jgi:lysophospholipase L1-like esterase
MHVEPSPSRVAAVFALSAALLAGGDSLAATEKLPPARYVALGDSLAAGLQPDAQGRDRPTAAGYPYVLRRRLARVYPSLRLENLSCGGATTGTLLRGGAGCQPRGEPGQLVRAERALAAHPEVVLVTLNIGDNDVERCLDAAPPAIDTGCLRRGRAAVANNLPAIARRLRAATPPGVPVVGILDYDQFLALWLDGARGRRVAKRSLQIVDGLNDQMARIYHAAGIEVADAGAGFSGHDFTTQRTLPRYGRVPLAVQRICRWTWACSPDPVGHDDHPRPQGYRVIAQAVLDALARGMKKS